MGVGGHFEHILPVCPAVSLSGWMSCVYGADLKKQTLFSSPGRSFLRRGGRVCHGVADQDGNVQKVRVMDVKPF